MVVARNVEVRCTKQGRRYELLAPEGGWGYMVTLAIATFFSVTIVPVGMFGMIFGEFLKSLGDETYGTTMTNAVFNVILSGAGFPANHLLQKYSCRTVGLVGAIVFTVGAIATAFVRSLGQLIATWGVLQGFGLGLMMPACFTSFNGYFDRKLTVMMSVAQAAIGAIAMGCPVLIEHLLDVYGWRGTQFLVAGVGLHCFIAMASLQPVDRHMKRRYLLDVDTHPPPPSIQVELCATDHPTPTYAECNEEPLLERGHVEQLLGSVANQLERRRNSIIGIGGLAASVTSVHKVGGEEMGSVWRRLYDDLDLGLFGDAQFINISFGMALSLTADIAFLSLFPMILKNANLSAEDITLTMTVYFASDLAGRVFVSLLSAFVRVRNRYLVLAGATFSAAFRVAFVVNDSLMWILAVSAILGFLRSLIQIPLPLVISEVFKDRFSSAFTLYMVVCAVVAAVFGPLIPYVKTATQSDIMVVHLLTLAYLLCAIPWCIELAVERLLTK